MENFFFAPMYSVMYLQGDRKLKDINDSALKSLKS